MLRFQAMLHRVATRAGVPLVILAMLAGVLAMAGPTGMRAAGTPRDSAAGRDTLGRVLGLSGSLRVIEALTLPALAGRGPGVHPTGLEAPDGQPIQAISLIPLTAKLGASWHGYRVGFWPGERTGRRAVSRYTLPAGFIEVTPDNQDLRLSTHFRVRDFLTHDQPGTWPKVLVIQLKLLDKLELIDSALRTLGKPAALRVMSGFRTPQYNALGVGPRGGRAGDSRHMYGDAADIYVDSDGDGRMDDLDGDGRVTINDARWLSRVAERVEQEYPAVTGGIGVYRANAVHGPFVHVDTRGTTARW